MSASFLLRPCAATFTAPPCPADAPHCAQKGVFDAGGGGGGGGGVDPPEEPPQEERKTTPQKVRAAHNRRQQAFSDAIGRHSLSGLEESSECSKENCRLILVEGDYRAT